jgi:protein SCO1/2
MPNERAIPGKVIIIAMIVLLLISLTGAYIVHRANRDRLALPVLGKVPEFTFTERSGEPFGSDDLKGKITVMDFIFTRCPGVCPIMADKMSRLYELFSKHPQVQFVSVSVDPEYDSLHVLREYANDLGVTDNRWLFLWAPVDSVVALAEGGLKLPMGNLPAGHSSRFVLIDNKGQIRGYYDSDDNESQLLLQHHIRAFLGAMR